MDKWVFKISSTKAKEKKKKKKKNKYISIKHENKQKG